VPHRHRPRLASPPAGPPFQHTHLLPTRRHSHARAQAGCVPILHMRDFQKAKALSPALLADIRGRNR
jgi:hypothetical protein